jgi:hypothetical protein
VRDIRRRRAAGEPVASIAADCGVVAGNMYDICSRRSWRHLADE